MARERVQFRLVTRVLRSDGGLFRDGYRYESCLERDNGSGQSWMIVKIKKHDTIWGGRAWARWQARRILREQRRKRRANRLASRGTQAYEFSVRAGE